ncbi:MAG: hypothetical protein LBT40_00370 [Deltaproteobacteria bacterium]|jgi:hypothetical protein|nr:hypothetical protein [Deltaproteobacteria bacterium]
MKRVSSSPRALLLCSLCILLLAAGCRPNSQATTEQIIVQDSNKNCWDSNTCLDLKPVNAETSWEIYDSTDDYYSLFYKDFKISYPQGYLRSSYFGGDSPSGYIEFMSLDEEIILQMTRYPPSIGDILAENQDVVDADLKHALQQKISNFGLLPV